MVADTGCSWLPKKTLSRKFARWKCLRCQADVKTEGHKPRLCHMNRQLAKDKLDKRK